MADPIFAAANGQADQVIARVGLLAVAVVVVGL